MKIVNTVIPDTADAVSRNPAWLVIARRIESARATWQSQEVSMLAKTLKHMKFWNASTWGTLSH